MKAQFAAYEQGVQKGGKGDCQLSDMSQNKGQLQPCLQALNSIMSAPHQIFLLVLPLAG